MKSAFVYLLVIVFPSAGLGLFVLLCISSVFNGMGNGMDSKFEIRKKTTNNVHRDMLLTSILLQSEQDNWTVVSFGNTKTSP